MEETALEVLGGGSKSTKERSVIATVNEEIDKQPVLDGFACDQRRKLPPWKSRLGWKIIDAFLFTGLPAGQSRWRFDIRAPAT